MQTPCVLRVCGVCVIAARGHAESSADAVKRLLEANTSDAGSTVVVVRLPFLSDDESPAALDKLLRVLDDGVVAISTAALAQGHLLLADSFEPPAAATPGPDAAARPPKRGRAADAPTGAAPGSHALTEQAVDLLGFLTLRGALLVVAKDLAAASPPARPVSQSSNRVLMVSPTAFQSNDETAADNHFMEAASAGSAAAEPSEAAKATDKAREARICALSEFQSLYSALVAAGVRVQLFPHARAHNTPDAVFPNNWFSTHSAAELGQPYGRLVFYPMKCESRRRERRADIVSFIRSAGRFDAAAELDLAGRAAGEPPAILEGTGSLVIDRPGRVAYCALSERSSCALAEEWAAALGHRVVSFRAADAAGRPIYHTNVLMAVGSGWAVVCAEALPDARERAAVLTALRERHAVVEISFDQMGKFCGNVLELRDRRGLPVLAMSSQAAAAFTPVQMTTLREHVADVIHARIDTIERVGGGGVRCTLAELFFD